MAIAWKYGETLLMTILFPLTDLGLAPLKFAVASVLDNQYIKWLVWYGVPGLIFHFMFYMVVAIQLYKSSRKRNCHESRLATAMLVYASDATVSFHDRCFF